jgi:MFS family permease
MASPGTGAVLVLARLLHGAAAAIVAPTSMALVVTTFPEGADTQCGDGGVQRDRRCRRGDGLVVGAALTEVSWRPGFLTAAITH